MKTIYTDGSFRNASKELIRGGYSVVYLNDDGEVERELYGAISAKGIMVVELAAIVKAIENYTGADLAITIKSDCKDVVDALQRIQQGTLQYEKKTKMFYAQLREWFARFVELIAQRCLTISLEWVRGHASDLWNKRCDVLAGRGSHDFGFETEVVCSFPHPNAM